ncbi:hypothetical protein KIN20_027711 [Parelaphostrongylus tenuis]|uniref:Uncharacterized protein n=1 Tax=Parelaphostrongylus tenuis TaxID=148309 RepID=A0AAD5QZQ1_PARTN|nr:hypothetical protein KIN20_027711 [Parelaphostrongylus tenuis]
MDVDFMEDVRHTRRICYDHNVIDMEAKAVLRNMDPLPLTSSSQTNVAMPGRYAKWVVMMTVQKNVV